MAVTANILRYLIDADKGTDEFILVAEAMERGDDARSVFELVYKMEEADADPADIGEAILARAEQISEYWANFSFREPGPPDPYRQRLGISHKEWRRLRELVFERDGRSCCYCGSSENLAVDHIVPLTRGGSNDLDNLTPACKSCNSSKGNKLICEWTAQWA